LYSNATNVDKPEVTALITTDREPDSNPGIYYYNDLYIGMNTYGSGGGLTHVDGNDVLDNEATIHIGYDGISEFVNLGSANTIGEQWKVSSGAIIFNPIDTATATEGTIYYDSDTDHFYGRNASSWVQLDN